jgi:hypothetical protein
MTVIALLGGSAVLLAAQEEPELSRRVVLIHEMAAAAKETYARAVGTSKVGTINEVLYRGQPVMYEIDQQMDRRRVEILIRYDGERLPVDRVKRPKRIDKQEMAVDKLPEKITAALTRSGIAPETIEQAREIRYRDTVIVYEVDTAETCYGFWVSGASAFKAPRPATQPADEEQQEDADKGQDDGGNDANGGA